MSDLRSTNDAHDDQARADAIDVVRTLQAAGYTAYWAGGCVRDSLLKIQPKDYDVATNATPEEVRRLFGERRTLAIGAAFGVILVRGTKGQAGVEVATFRSDGQYIDGRRPEHVIYSTPELDAQRRDFTINGLFFDPIADRIYDFVGGESDLQNRVVRAIGNPRARFTEDKLRLLRAVRMTARYSFRLDSETALAVSEMADRVTHVSFERITQEFKKMLSHSSRRKAMELAVELGLVPVIFPEITLSLEQATENGSLRQSYDAWIEPLGRLANPEFELAFAVLLLPIIGDKMSREPMSRKAASGRTIVDVCKRMKLSNHELKQIEWLIGNIGATIRLPQLSMNQVRRLLGSPWSRNLVSLDRATHPDRIAANSAANWCEELLSRMSPEELLPPPLVTGDDLVLMNMSPGKQFKEVLDAVYDAQLNGEISTKIEGISWISAFLTDP